MTFNSNNVNQRIITNFQHLLNVEDEIYALQLTYKDSLSRKIENDERKEIISESINAGNSLAKQIQDKFIGYSIDEIIAERNVKVYFNDELDDINQVYFGDYDSNERITIYRENIYQSKTLFNQVEKENVSIEKVIDIILAHELFHYFEEKLPNIYPNTKKVKLFEIGPIKMERKLLCTSEIAAMQFAKKLLELDYNPASINYLLYYPFSESNAKEFYDNIISISENCKSN